ncbi:MAG: hypothetical protein WKF81_07225 [Thermomicrobiales bacterium]
MLEMGFATIDFTPEPGLVMAGRAKSPPAEGVAGPLCARVLLADDGTQRVALVTLDLMALPATEVDLLRRRLADCGDLLPENIMIACSHTHAAPLTHLAGLEQEHNVVQFVDVMSTRIEQAIVMAIRDIQPVELTSARISAPGWVFNRRAVMADNEVATHGVSWVKGFSRMETTPDDEVQILVAKGNDGTVRGGIVGYACHPTVMESDRLYSSDYAGVLMGELESTLGGTFCFLLGASGDSANPDPASPHQEEFFGWGYAKTMGRALADRALEAIGTGRKSTAGRIGIESTILSISQRRPSRKQVKLSRWYLEEAPKDIDEAVFLQQLSGHSYTFWEVPSRASERHAREILGMWERQRRAGSRDLVEHMEVQVLVLGDVAIAALPVELFTDLGRDLKQQSPFPSTFVATMTNGWHGYVPTIEAFERGGYEPLLAYQSRLVPEAGAVLTHAALELLHHLYHSR